MQHSRLGSPGLFTAWRCPEPTPRHSDLLSVLNVTWVLRILEFPDSNAQQRLGTPASAPMNARVRGKSTFSLAERRPAKFLLCRVAGTIKETMRKRLERAKAILPGEETTSSSWESERIINIF